MVIEKEFLRHVADFVFKFLAYLQQWYPLCRQYDRERLDAILRHLLEAARRLPAPSRR
jgi:hypothetical protein